jgi:hypothetical protein
MPVNILMDIDLFAWKTGLTAAVGVSFASAAFILGRRLSRQHDELSQPREDLTQPRPGPTVPADPTPLKASFEDSRVQTSFGERRGTPRRRGCAVSIQVFSAGVRDGPREGWVLDRSVNGLGLVVEKPVPEGATLKVRASQAAESVPWVEVVVRNCRQQEDGWVLGCQFLKVPSAVVLMSFG